MYQLCIAQKFLQKVCKNQISMSNIKLLQQKHLLKRNAELEFLKSLWGLGTEEE